MNTSGVIFDFNGTLFWDTEYQDYSWDKFLEKYNITITTEEKEKYVHGRNAKDTFEYIFKKSITNNETEELIEEKEVIYRIKCLENKLALAPGAIELLEYLNEKNIPISIATASGKNNVDFFIKYLDLLKYFKIENIIYNDGTFEGKPNPDMFLAAIKKINVRNENITIFEDSLAGIEAAKRSKVKNIVLVNPNKKNSINDVIRISSFYEFNKEIL